MIYQVVGSPDVMPQVLKDNLGREVQIQGLVGNPASMHMGSTDLSGGGTASRASEPVIEANASNKVAETCPSH
jgi:hypothetical protein